MITPLQKAIHVQMKESPQMGLAGSSMLSLTESVSGAFVPHLSSLEPTPTYPAALCCCSHTRCLQCPGESFCLLGLWLLLSSHK